MTDKLLIVDNESNILEVLAGFLETKSYQIFTSQNPINALHIFKTEKPQVVLSDLKLETAMDGVTMCGQMRQMVPKTITIAMSGYISTYDVSYLRGAGFDDLIQKPIKIEMLTNLLECGFEKRARWDLANGHI